MSSETKVFNECANGCVWMYGCVHTDLCVCACMYVFVLEGVSVNVTVSLGHTWQPWKVSSHRQSRKKKCIFLDIRPYYFRELPGLKIVPEITLRKKTFVGEVKGYCGSFKFFQGQIPYTRRLSKSISRCSLRNQ